MAALASHQQGDSGEEAQQDAADAAQKSRAEALERLLSRGSGRRRDNENSTSDGGSRQGEVNADAGMDVTPDAQRKKALRKLFEKKLFFQALKVKSRSSTKAEAKAKVARGHLVGEKGREEEEAGNVSVKIVASELVHSFTPSNFGSIQAMLSRYGVVKLASAVPEQAVAEARSAFLKIWDTLEISTDGSQVLKTKEIISRQPRRFDVLHKISDTACFKKCNVFASLMRRVLGVDMKMIKTGVVVSLPGCPIQGIHADGKHLFDDESLPCLPCHCSTIFIPLIPINQHSALGKSATEYWPTTHRTHRTSVGFDGNAYPSISFESAVGDAIMFDYRVLHRGGGNDSQHIRPFLYFTFARSWFTDHTNYYKASLFAK